MRACHTAKIGGVSIPVAGARTTGDFAHEQRDAKSPVVRATTSVFFILGVLLAFAAAAEPWAPPGDLRLRHDLQLLNDSGATNLPLTTWPLSWGDIGRGLAEVDQSRLSPSAQSAYARLNEQLRRDSRRNEFHVRAAASAAIEPRIVRTFENTPREEGELFGGLSWRGDRFAINLNATLAANPFDTDEIRPDGSYVGVTLGNWMLSAGWQDRWWGPGRDASLILGSNARPTPGVAMQRNRSTPFETKWLSWIGPWTLTAFMNQLDDERFVNDALLFGMRVTFRPFNSLEIGLSRTAQWCGDDRPCDFGTFTDLLFGNDNRGVNVDADDEPGNQLAGIDIRWALPRSIPIALYMQWIGEDTRRGGPEIGSWMRQAGIEYWGNVRGFEQRTHLEVADTICREGGFGFSDAKPDCAYEHGIYRSGYRYKGRSLGHSMDGDGRSYSLGTTLVEPDGHGWHLSVRYLELNRLGNPDVDIRHTLATAPAEIVDAQLSHDRLTRYGRFHIGLGASRIRDEGSGESDTDLTGFLQWSTE